MLGMKTRLLFLSLLCLICFELNAQSSMTGLMRHRRSHQDKTNAPHGAQTTFNSHRQNMNSFGVVSTNSATGKYYPPKVNREYVRFNEDGSTTLRYRRYYELDSWGNVSLEEEGTSYRTLRTYSNSTQGKLQLSQSRWNWNGINWVEMSQEESFNTQLNEAGIRTGVTGRRVKEASFNEKGYLTRLHEAYEDGSQLRDIAKIEISWKDDFPSSLSLVLEGENIAFTNIEPTYEADKLNPYLCFSGDWEDFFFDSDGDDFVLFNAAIDWSSDEGGLFVATGRVVSEYDAQKKTYTRTIYLTAGGIEVPFTVETKTYLDSYGSFVYTYAATFDNETSSVTKRFNEHGDLIKEEYNEIYDDGDNYLRIETYERLYDGEGHPVKVIYQSGTEGYIETYGEKITPNLSLEVTVEKAGTLSEVIMSASAEYYDLIQLKVTGPLNKEDLRFTRDLSSLQVLDLSLAQFAYLPDFVLQSTPLTSLILPEGLKYIANNALSYSRKLKRVELPASLNFLGERVFQECNSLETIVCHMMAPLDLKVYEDPFMGVNTNSCKLIVPSLALNAYKQSAYWNQFTTMEGVNDLNHSGSAIFNGTLQLENLFFDQISDLALGYGAGLTINSGKEFPLKSLVLNQGDSQMQEYLGYDSYGDLLRGRQVASSSLINNCEKMTSEQVRLEYVCRPGCWYFLSFPFNVNRGDITLEKLDATSIAVPEYVLRYYDGANRAANGANQSWKDVAEATLKAGCGYIFQASTEVRLVVRGTSDGAMNLLSPLVREIKVDENASSIASNQGWNLVGNPYPCCYDMSGIDFKSFITIWNSERYTYEAYSVLDADEYILSPMQAFFVQVPSGTSTIQFSPEARRTNTLVAEKANSRALAMGRRLINLCLSDGIHADKSRIALSPQASLKYDMQEDAAKFMSPVLSVPQLYTLDHAQVPYAIHALPLTEGESVRIGYYAAKAGEYVLQAERADVQVWLYDALTGAKQELTAEGYRFTSEQGSFDNRFKLYLGIQPTSVQDELQDVCGVLSAEGGLLIKVQTGQLVEVYTIGGAKVSNTNLTEQGTFIPLPQGIYLVKIGSSVYKSVVY